MLEVMRCCSLWQPCVSLVTILFFRVFIDLFIFRCVVYVFYMTAFYSLFRSNTTTLHLKRVFNNRYHRGEQRDKRIRNPLDGTFWFSQSRCRRGCRDSFWFGPFLSFFIIFLCRCHTESECCSNMVRISSCESSTSPNRTNRPLVVAERHTSGSLSG